MSAPSIAQLLYDLSHYERLGHLYLRRAHASQVVDLLKSSQKRGFNLSQSIPTLLYHIREIDQLTRERNRRWSVMLIKIAVIVTSAVAVRLLWAGHILQETSDHQQVNDRMALIIASFCLLLIIAWLTQNYLTGAWSPSRQRRLWLCVQAYVGFFQETDEISDITKKLKDFLRDESTSGADSSRARDAVVRKQIADLQEFLENDIRSFGLWSIGIELAVYSVSFIGLLGSPLLIWLESTSAIY